MIRRRTSKGEKMRQMHVSSVVPQAPTIADEPVKERTHMQALVALIASSFDDPSLKIPERLRIFSERGSSDDMLKVVDAGDASEWRLYIPEVRDVSLQSFTGSAVKEVQDVSDVAGALKTFLDSRMGIWELKYILSLPTEVIHALLVDAGISTEQIREGYVVFPEIRFRAGGIWHTLSIGFSNPKKKFEAYATELREKWQKNFYILDRA